MPPAMHPSSVRPPRLSRSLGRLQAARSFQQAFASEGLWHRVAAIARAPTPVCARAPSWYISSFFPLPLSAQAYTHAGTCDYLSETIKSCKSPSMFAGRPDHMHERKRASICVLLPHPSLSIVSSGCSRRRWLAPRRWARKAGSEARPLPSIADACS